MKERSFAAKVTKITSLDVSNKNILDALHFSSDLMQSEKLPLAKAIKLNKMKKYKELVQGIKPVVEGYAQLKNSQVKLMDCLKVLEEEVAAKVIKTGSAVRNGKSLQDEGNEFRVRYLAVDEILAKVSVEKDESLSVLSVLNKVKEEGNVGF